MCQLVLKRRFKTNPNCRSSRAAFLFGSQIIGRAKSTSEFGKVDSSLPDEPKVSGLRKLTGPEPFGHRILRVSTEREWICVLEVF